MYLSTSPRPLLVTISLPVDMLAGSENAPDDSYDDVTSF